MQNYIYCNAIPIILLSTVVNGILYLTAELHQRKYYLSGIQASKQDQRAFETWLEWGSPYYYVGVLQWDQLGYPTY